MIALPSENIYLNTSLGYNCLNVPILIEYNILATLTRDVLTDAFEIIKSNAELIRRYLRGFLLDGRGLSK